MNKQSAIEQANILQQQMEEVQKQLNNLQQIINAPEKKSLLQAPEAGSRSDYFVLYTVEYGRLDYGERIAYSADYRFYNHGNLFQSEQLAKNYAKAINTMLLLRHQEGTAAVKYDYQQWIIDIDDEYNVCIDYYDYIVSKGGKISPCFESKEAAQKAIANVGEENIVHMFKTFHHVED